MTITNEKIKELKELIDKRFNATSLAEMDQAQREKDIRLAAAVPELIEAVEKLALALSYIKINGPGLSKEALARFAEDFYDEVFMEKEI